MTINEKKSSSGILQWVDFTLPPINLWVMPIMEHIEMKPVDELDYENLIERVRKLDPAAAEYLEGPAKEMSDFNYTGNLWWAFYWDDSIQGHAYWEKIAEALDREEDKRVSINQASPEEWDAVSKKAMDSLNELPL